MYIIDNICLNLPGYINYNKCTMNMHLIESTFSFNFHILLAYNINTYFLRRSISTQTPGN